MTTHAETIQVPDDMTIESYGPPVRVFAITDETRVMWVKLKPLQPPEPPIKPCPFCGGRLTVYECGSSEYGRHGIQHAYLMGCPVRYNSNRYDTRLAAIQAANRRAK